MSLKELIRPLLPPPLLRLYNRVISRRIIAARRGEAFDVEWNARAADADDGDWVATYDRSWDFWADHDLSPDDLERFKERIGQPTSLLDVGCGDGYLLEALRPLAGRVAGCDLSGRGLRLARQRLGEGVRFAQCFAEALPFADDAFEVVVTAHTLEHVRELDGAIAELKRVAARRLLILVPSQAEQLYTEDYHIHYFPREEDLAVRLDHPGARIESFTVPEGVCAYAGDVLLATVDLN